jgi:hypothetical protein
MNKTDLEERAKGIISDVLYLTLATVSVQFIVQAEEVEKLKDDLQSEGLL